MGQPCCSPQIRLGPKYISLITLIYSQTQQNVKQLQYGIISAYLAKKGYVKTLCDYLSSHLNQISLSLIMCRNKQFAVRKQNPVRQVFYCIITTEVTQRIVNLKKQIKQKYEPNTLTIQESYKQTLQTPRQLRSTSNQNIREYLTTNRQNPRSTNLRNHNQNIGRSPLRTKTPAYNMQLLQDEISYNVLQICNQIIKHTTNARNNISQVQNKKKSQQLLFLILLNVQNILYGLLQKQIGFIKVDDKMVKDVLDNIIMILMMCRKQNGQILSSIPNKLQNNNTNNLSSISLTIFPIISNNKKSNNQIRNLQMEDVLKKNNKINNSSIITIQVFNQTKQDKYQMGKLCLKNYYQLIHKANIHLVNTNLYKDVVKIHMPKLLQYWADLMIFSESSLIQKRDSRQLNIQQHEQQIQYFDQSQDQRINSETKNVQLIQLIIRQFFNSYFSFKQSQYIYRQLMMIFDKLCFNKNKISPIEKLVFQALRNYQLRASVVSKWFDYLLDYLGTIIHSNAESIPLSNNNNQSEQKIPIIQQINQEGNYFAEIDLGLNFQNLKSQYINWYRQQNIIGCIKTIQRWIQTKLVDLQTILNYKRVKLLVAILVNLSRGQSKINQTIIKFIQFLVVNDVRCFGYIIDTTLFLIKKLKIQNNNYPSQYGWSYYTNINIDNQQMKQNGEYIKLKQKQNLFLTKNRQIKNCQYSVQFIVLQKFIDQLIYIASFPYLNYLVPVSNIGYNKQYRQNSGQSQYKLQVPKSQCFGQEIYKEIQWKSQHNAQQHSQPKLIASSQSNLLKKKDSMSHIQKNKQAHSKLLNMNTLYCRSVFFQTMMVLFKPMSLLDCKLNTKYIIKLASIVLTNNINNIIILSSITKKQLNYTFNLINMINKYLSKIWRQLKYISLDYQHQITNIKVQRKKSIQQDNQCYQFQQFMVGNDQYIDQYLQQGSQINDMQFRSKDSANCWIGDIKIINIILDTLHIWMYPAIFSFMLHWKGNDDQQKDSSKKIVNRMSTTSNVFEVSRQNKKNVKLLLNIISKVYFVNLLKLCKQSLQGHCKNEHSNAIQKLSNLRSRQSQKISSVQSSLSAQQRLLKKQQLNHKISSNTNTNKNKNNFQVDNGGQAISNLKLHLLPVIQLCSFYLTAYNFAYKIQQKHKLHQHNIQQSQKNYHHNLLKQRRNTTNQTNLNKNNQNHYQQNKSIYNHQLNAQDRLAGQMKIVINRIKNIDNCPKQHNNQINKNRYNNVVQSRRTQQLYTEHIQENANYNQHKITSNKLVQSYIMSSIIDVVYHDQICTLLFKLIDKVFMCTNDDSLKFTKAKTTKLKVHKTVEQIVDNYLLKDEQPQLQPQPPSQPLSIQEIEQNNNNNNNNNSSMFKKAKNKIIKLLTRNQQQPTNDNSNTLALSKVPSPSLFDKRHQFEYIEVNLQNAHIVIPQLIDKFCGYYTILSKYNQKNNLIKNNNIFSLEENDFNKKQSAVDSSNFNNTNLQGSFGDALKEVQRH